MTSVEGERNFGVLAHEIFQYIRNTTFLNGLTLSEVHFNVQMKAGSRKAECPWVGSLWLQATKLHILDPPALPAFLGDGGLPPLFHRQGSRAINRQRVFLTSLKLGECFLWWFMSRWACVVDARCWMARAGIG